MKKQLLLLSVLFNSYVNAQQAPTANNPGGPPSGQGSAMYWSRSGNTIAGGNYNIFGTQFNSPIYTITGGLTASTYRTKLNGDFTLPTQIAINGFGWGDGVNTSGYMLLGYSGAWANQLYTGNAGRNGAYSLLHLNGRDGSFVQTGGYRPWMKTGITLTDNNDLSYFGLRSVALDVTETVINWSDNAGSGSGPDELTFRFTSGGGSTAIGPLNSDTDIDGLHIARFTATGNFGLGNTFGVGNPVYVSPQSLGHYSLSNLRSVWQQFTNRDTGVGTGTAETASDGLRLGIIGNANTLVNGTAALYNQENRHLLFSTNANTNTMNVLSGATQERMRITAVGTPTNLAAGGYGVNNPAGIAANITRVAVSHNPSQPVTRPMSLLHLGYNTGLASVIPGSTDGWRSWMDIGAFTTNGTDNIYVGLKNEGTDQFDAVINWGDNQTEGIITPNGPDHLRFIFTSTTTDVLNPGDPISQSLDGLEIGRFYPGYDTTFTYLLNAPLDLYGRFGVGDFTASGVNEEPTHKLDVIGNGRFRYLPDSLYLADSLVNKYVMVDSMGVLRWTSAGPSFGAPCSDSVNGKLQFDTKVDLNNYNLYFTNNDTLNTNQVGIGYECGVALPGKLSVYQGQDFPIPFGTISGHFLNSDTTSISGTVYTGVMGITNGEHPVGMKTINQGGAFYASGAEVNYGVYSEASQDSMMNSQNYGAYLNAIGGFTSVGSVNVGREGQARNIGTYGLGYSPITASSFANIGGEFEGSYSAGSNYGVRGIGRYGNVAIGVYGTAFGATTDWAGYFDGEVYIAGLVLPSDINFKENINSIESADSLLKLLNPVNYDYKTEDYPQFNFSTENQMGLIAQQTEGVLPNIVKTRNSPEQFDSLGNVTIPSIEFKSIDYTKLIPLLIAGHKDQAAVIDSMSTVNDSLQAQITDLNSRLTQLENCLSNLLPALCQANQMAIQQTPEETQEYLEKTINVTLSSRNNIILNQNVPNPFAESTVITYTIPATVQKAQIHFYDGQGKLINLVEIPERGNGQLNVFANDLSTGVYTYSLVADGKVVATKKMMKQ